MFLRKKRQALMTSKEFKIIDLVQGSDEWLSLRKTYIGSSDAPIIMGVSPYKTKNRLWKEKLGLIESEAPSIHMVTGTAMEPEIRARVIEQLGISFEPKVLVSHKYPFMMASLDGFDETETVVLEVKLNNATNHALAKENKVIDHHMYQLQHHLAVSGAKMVLYASFHNDELIISKVLPNIDIIKGLVDEEEEFFNDLRNGKEPELSDKDFVKMESEEWAKEAEEFVKLHAVKKEISEQYEAKRDRLIFLANERSSFGAGVRVSKIFPRGRVKYDKIPELKGIDLEPYRDPPKAVYKVMPADE